MQQTGKRAKGAEYHSKADVGHDPFRCGALLARKKEPVDPSLKAIKWLAVVVVGVAVLRTAWSLVSTYIG